MKIHDFKDFPNPASRARTIRGALARRVAAGLLLAASVNPAGAQTPAPKLGDGSLVEHYSINVPFVTNFCELDSKRQDDRALAEYYRRNQSGADSILYRIAVECDRMDDLRREVKPLLDAHVHLVVYRYDLEQYTFEKRNSWSAFECDFIRGQHHQPADESRATFSARLVEVAKTATGVAEIFGVANEAAGACHVLAISRQKLPDGQPATVLILRSTVAVKGRIIELWHTTAARLGSEAEAIAREVALARAIVDGLPAANP